MNSYRIPKLGSELELWFVEEMISGWFVRGTVLGTVSAVQQEKARFVLLRIQTRDGYEYQCERPIRPDEHELLWSVWKPVGKVVPFCNNQHSKVILVESVLAHNHYQEYVAARVGSLAKDGLVRPGSPPRVTLPRGDAERCHGLYYRYKGGLCPECSIDSPEEQRRFHQALS